MCYFILFYSEEWNRIEFSSLDFKSFVISDKMLTSLKYFIYFWKLSIEKKCFTFQPLLWPHSTTLQYISQLFFFRKREQFRVRSFLVSFLIAFDFLSNLPGSCSKLCCCGVVETGIGCVLTAITALAFVIFHVLVCW